MKKLIQFSSFMLLIVFGLQTQAQNNRDLDNYRQPDKRGINVFESPKDTASTFDGLHVRLGAQSTLQFQGLDHENSGFVPLVKIGHNFNLATANLDLDAALYSGVRMHLRIYLSSRHHEDTWVKGGYLQIDRLDFVRKGFMEDIMQFVTVKLGHMEINYGDTHFRRTDNAQSIHNPFVGNYLMDSFTTEVGGEVYFRKNGFLGMLGLTNGKLNQSVESPGTTSPSLVAKVGYDNNLSEDLRFRLTGSVYLTNQTESANLYSGDRAGSRYYSVMEPVVDGSFRSGRINPDLQNELTSFMINPFVKYKGLEFFGVLEHATGKKASETKNRTWNQYAGELIYRFGNDENLYVGGRYNYVDGEEVGGNNVDVSRFQLGAGWFMTKNILTKVEYVNQEYNGYNPETILDKGKFNGVMVEAAISF